MNKCLTVDEVVNLLCQFPGETPVIILPDYESGNRQMWQTGRHLVQIVDEEGQPIFVGLTTDRTPPKFLKVTT